MMHAVKKPLSYLPMPAARFSPAVSNYVLHQI